MATRKKTPAVPSVLGLRHYSDIDPNIKHKVDWLWPGYLPRGVLVGIEGDPGNGKSTIAADFFARVTTGAKWPDGSRGLGKPASGLFITSEDPEAVIMNRLISAGGDPDRFWQMNGPVKLPTHVPAIEDFIKANGVALVTIDPLQQYTEENLYTNNGARKVVEPLAAMARRTNCTVILVRHLRKGAGRNLLQKGTGSIAVAGTVRAGYILGRDPENDRRRILHCHKLNLAKEPLSMTFVTNDQGNAEWDRIPMDRDESQHRLVASSLAPDEKTEREEAVEFLEDFLWSQGGAALVSDCLAEGRKAGHSGYMIKRYAKHRLGIKAVKNGTNWEWVFTNNRPSLRAV